MPLACLTVLLLPAGAATAAVTARPAAAQGAPTDAVRPDVAR